MAHRYNHDFEEKPQEIEPKGEMPAFSDDPIHQHSAEDQKHSACTYKSSSDKEIVSSTHLEPCSFRERDVCRQKHQRKQCRDDYIEHLPDGFSQALRRLRYQAFWEFHGVAHKSAAKIRKLVKLSIHSWSSKPLQNLSVWRRQLVCAFSQSRNRFLGSLLLYSESRRVAISITTPPQTERQNTLPRCIAIFFTLCNSVFYAMKKQSVVFTHCKLVFC